MILQQITKIYCLASSTFIEGVRHKVLWAIVIFSLFLTMANIAIASLFSWDLGKVSVEFGLSAISLSGLLIVFFLGLKIIADDFERNRIQMLMARPISGWHYIIGKFLGLAFVLFITCLIMATGAIVSQQFFISKFPLYIPPEFSWVTYLMALCCQWMALLIILTVTIFCYSFASNSFAALLISVSIYLVGQNLELLRKVINENPYAGVLSGQNNFVVVLSWIFPNLSFFDKKSIAAYGLEFHLVEFSLLILYCFSYCSIMLFFASLLISRRDIGK